MVSRDDLQARRDVLTTVDYWRVHLMGAALFVLALAFPRLAAAAIPLCVEVRGPAPELAGLRKLVMSEVARHPSHEVVASGCRSSLDVELFEAGGARYLTAQMEHEVPVRYLVREPADLGDRVSDALRLALHNDPAYLAEDVTHLNELQRLGRSITVWGRWMFRVELFEMATAGGTNAVFTPGVGLMMTRGYENWQVFGRLYAGGKPDATPGPLRDLPFAAGFDGGLSYELWDKSFASPYVSTGLGVQYLYFSGPDGAHKKQAAYASLAGVALSVRLGVRFFRWHAFDLDLFAQGYLPVSTATDVDGVLFGDAGGYTPSVQAGLGVGF
jgi:hypothetical protein